MLKKNTYHNGRKTADSPWTGVGAGPVRFKMFVPPDKVRVSPDIVRLKSLNPLRDRPPSPNGWWDIVRGLKCLHRQDLMFKRIWLRSKGVFEDGDRVDNKDEWWEHVVGSEVLVSEVLVLGPWSRELGSGEASGADSMSEFRPWQVLSTSACALSSKIL